MPPTERCFATFVFRQASREQPERGGCSGSDRQTGAAVRAGRGSAVADRDPANSLTAVLEITKALTVIESGDAAEVLAYDGCCAPPVMLSEPVVGAESREARAGPYRPTSTQGKCVRTTIIDKLTWLNNLT